MDMAVNFNESDWLDNMRTILMEELNMTKDMVYLQSVIGDTYNYMNDIKWGGGQTSLLRFSPRSLLPVMCAPLPTEAIFTTFP